MHKNKMARINCSGMLKVVLFPLFLQNGASALSIRSALPARSALHMTMGDQQSPTSIPPSTVLASSTAPPPLANETLSTITDKSKRPTPSNPQVFRQKGRPKTKGAPLVDSTLLRFLSEQKNEMAKTNSNGNRPDEKRIFEDPQNEEGSRVDADVKATTINIEQVVDEEKSKLKKDQREMETEVFGTSSVFDEEVESSGKAKDTSAECLSWFTQYNANRVSQKLQSLGATEAMALEAGSAVQSFSLARTTRQRVRKFLRDRDLKWASRDSGVGSSFELSNVFDEAAFRGDSYNIDAVISLLSESGLTGRDIAAIFTHTPSVSMMRARQKDVKVGDKTNILLDKKQSSQAESLEETLKRSYFGVLCSTIKLRKYDARKVLRTCPGLLTKRGSSSSDEVISIISSLGVSPTSLCKDKAALPMLLSRSPASLFRLVAFLSSDAVRMPVENIGPFIRRSECASILDMVAPIPRYNSSLLRNDDVDDNTNEENMKILPLEHLLMDGGSRDIENRVTKTYNRMFKQAEFLRDEVGISNLGKVLAAYPNLFTLDIDSQIIPAVNFLFDLGMDEDEVPRVLEAHPILFETTTIQMQSVVDFLLELEVSEEILGSIFRAFPALLTQDTSTTMTEVVSFLGEIGVTNIGRFITRLPPVLGYSVEKDLVPKWNYLNTVSQFASFEVSKFPAYFAYPLERVIKSRYEYLGKVKRLPFQLQPVDDILRYGDADFATIIALDEDGTNYANFIKKRNDLRKRKRNAVKRSGERRRRSISSIAKNPSSP